MPIFTCPPIHYPPIVQCARITDTEDVEKRIINGVFASKNGYILVKVGTYTVHDIKCRYDIPTEEIGHIMLTVGRIGIATRLVMGETPPLTDSGVIYLFCSNNPQHPDIDHENIKIKNY
jgi:hypothetical protein